MRYRCVISDTTPGDFTLPIRSFQLRYRQSPRQCYISVVVPAGLTYGDEIVPRKAGNIALYEVAADDSETELLTANINSINVAEGAVNRSVTIVGYKQVTWPGTGSHQMPHVTYAGTDRVRGLPVRDLRPVDELTAHGDTFAVDEIVWTVNANRRVMEVSGYTHVLMQIHLAGSASIGLGGGGNLRGDFTRLSGDGLVQIDASTPPIYPLPVYLQSSAAIAANVFDAELNPRLIGYADIYSSGTAELKHWQALLAGAATVEFGSSVSKLTAASPYLAKIQTLNPSYWWPLTEASGNFLNTANTSLYPAYEDGIHTTLNRQHEALVAATPDLKGIQIEDAYIRVDSLPDLQYPLTILMWYRMGSHTSRFQFGRKTVPGSYVWSSGVQPGGAIATAGGHDVVHVNMQYMDADPGWFGKAEQTPTYMEQGDLVCFISRLNSTQSKLFLNGNHYGPVSTSGKQILVQTGQPLWIGRWLENYTGNFIGVMQDLVIWNGTELSDQDCSDIYTLGNTAP